METNPTWKLVRVAHVGAAEKDEAFMVRYLILGQVIDMGKDGVSRKQHQAQKSDGAVETEYCFCHNDEIALPT